MFLKVTCARRIIVPISSLTLFAKHYEVKKCIGYGHNFLEYQRNSTNNHRREVIEAKYDLRQSNRIDYEYLNWPIWQDNVL